MNSLSSRAIEWVRFPLIILVLINHCHPEDYAFCIPVSDFAGHSLGEMIYGFVAYALTWLAFTAVPVFFLLSGFLFFFKAGKEWNWDFYKQQLKKRVHTLVIPYLIFNLIATVSVTLYGEPGWRNHYMISYIGHFWNSTTFCVGMHNWYGLDMQLFYPEVIALWYLRDLIFMCIISPVVWYFIKNHLKPTLVILSLIYLSGLWIGANGYNSQAILFFCLGASFSIHGKDLMLWCNRHLMKFLPVMLILWLIVTVWNSFTDAQQLNHALYYIGSFSLLGLAARWAEKSQKRIHPIFPNSSFFIYAFHMCQIGTFCALADIPQWLKLIWGEPDNFWSATLLFLSGPLAIAFFCMGIYILMKKVCPQVLNLVSGGR